MGKIDVMTIVVRGGGDLATGVIRTLHRAGFSVVVLETTQPLMIRRTVSLGTAVYDKSSKVEDLEAVLSNDKEYLSVLKERKIPILIDPKGESIPKIKPNIVVDAILAKRNLGTNKEMAPFTVALGPGFYASKDVDVVIETMRGHNLGRLIFFGSALPNTGIPGEIGGKSNERVVHAPNAGLLKHYSQIGDIVKKGQLLLTIDDSPVFSPLDGLLRGLITENLMVPKGLKIADIDPRRDSEYMTISDKARALGGAVLEAIMWYLNGNN